MKRLDRLVYIAINRAVTPKFDRWAKRNYGISGKRLLAKVAAAEGGGTTQHPNVSYAGARGPFQFIPSTRAAYKRKYGLDAWRTNTEAAKAAIIHLMGTGVAGYNPGMPSYERLVLGQNVDTGPLKTGRFGSGKVRAGGAPRIVGSPGSVTNTRSAVQPGGGGIADLLSLMKDQAKPSPVPSVGLQAPQFSAQPTLPQGYQVPQGNIPEPPDTSTDTLLQAVQSLGGVQLPRSTVQTTPSSQRLLGGGSGSTGGRGGPGKLLGAPIDRPGVRTSREVTDLVKRASGWAGLPIRLGTGTQHSRLTVNGNESDHWRGRALDLPARGRYGDRVAGAILVQLGVPRAQARRMAQRGGLYTIRHRGRRYQVIWKTNSGGNHYDHVHIGIG